MLDKKFFFIAAAIVSVAIGVVAWAYYDQRADAAKLESEIVKEITEEDLSLIIDSQAKAGDVQISELASSPEAKKAFVAGIKEHLSLAAEARRTGLTEDERFGHNFELKKRQLLADLYQVKLGHSLDKPYRPTEQEVKAVWADPANVAAFNKDMATQQSLQTEMNRKLGNNMAPGVLLGESLVRAKASWARAKILSDKAKADAEFMAGREVQLRIKVLEAGILSKDLLRANYENTIKASDAEIKQFIADNPQYSLERKKATANAVHVRAMAGEDFAKLVKEFTEHRPTRETGGLIEKMLSGDQPAALEAAMLALEPGELYGSVIESEQGYHIAKLVSKKERPVADGRKVTEYSFRQILLQNKFEQPGLKNSEIPPPFMTAEEIAKMLIEREKRDRYVAVVMERNPIALQ